MNEKELFAQYGYVPGSFTNMGYRTLRIFDSQWEVEKGSVLEVFSFDSWIPGIKNVHFAQFKMSAECVDEVDVVVRYEKEYRPGINVPHELRQKGGLSFRLHRGYQEKFKNKDERPLEKILVTFPKKCKCTIKTFTLRSGSVYDQVPVRLPNHLAHVYRFLLGSPTDLTRTGLQHHTMTSSSSTTNITSTAVSTYYTSGKMSTAPWNTIFTSAESSRMNTACNNGTTTHFTTHNSPGRRTTPHVGILLT